MMESSIVLRTLERDDLKRIQAWSRNRNPAWLSREPHRLGPLDQMTMQRGENNSEREFAVLENSSKRVVGWGSVAFCNSPRRNKSADIGLVVRQDNPPHERWAEEAMRLLLAIAFDELKLHRVSWRTLCEDQETIALATQMGFEEEAKLREKVSLEGDFYDAIVFGLLARDYYRYNQ